jgi:hypothetical protein
VSGSGLGFLNACLATCLAAFFNACLTAFLTVFLNACFTAFLNACCIRCIMRILLSLFAAEVSSGHFSHLRALPASSICLPSVPVCYLQPANEHTITFTG